MSEGHISPQDLAQGIVLACRIQPLSDLQVAVLGLKKDEQLKHIA